MDRYFDAYNDAGFTKQTEILLNGLGASVLIEEFKKRDISTQVLHRLTAEDFVHLGANDQQADDIINKLNVVPRNNNFLNQERLYKCIDIIKHGHQQITLLQAFTAYSRLRLVEKKINVFIDVNKNMQASKIICHAVAATLTEIEDMKFALIELERSISAKHMSKGTFLSKHSYVTFFAVFSAMGLATVICLKVYRN